MMRIHTVVDPEHPDTLRATLVGYLDPDGAIRLRDELLALLGAETSKLLVDMTQIDWMGSAGVGSLMHLLARAQAHGGALALFGCAPRVRSVLHVCGLEGLLNVSADEAEAWRRLEVANPS